MIAKHARQHCAFPAVGRVDTELRNRRWTSGYITLSRGELNTAAHMPEVRPPHDAWSAPTSDLLQAVLDGLRKL